MNVAVLGAAGQLGRALVPRLPGTVTPLTRDQADLTRPETYAQLKTSKTTIIKTDDYDVFGDGTVVLKWTPGHTPGHQVLFVKLAKTGPLVISGDLYHYPEERTLHRVPTFDADPKQTAASRYAERVAPLMPAWRR